MKLFKALATLTAIVGLPSVAGAVTVVQYPGTSLGAFSFSVSGTTITINETWTNTNNVFLQFSGLETGVSYTVIKRIINNSGATWTSLANELLDPGLDNDDPTPQPNFIPVGYSTSSDADGLSFAQGSGIPRTSSAFPTVIADELSDSRDFLDFTGGTVASGSPVFTVQFGLRDNANNQPFLLSQRVNVRSVTPGVPEPATWAMMIVGFGMVGGAMRIRVRARRTMAVG